MKDPIFELCDSIRERSLALHRYLRDGHAAIFCEVCICDVERINSKPANAEGIT